MLCVENLCNDDAEEAIVDMLPKNIALGKENENCVVLVATLPSLMSLSLLDCVLGASYL